MGTPTNEYVELTDIVSTSRREDFGMWARRKASIYEAVTCHRIRAKKDMPWHGVKKGDIGGLVQSLDNIQEEAWVMPSGLVCHDARVKGRAAVGQASTVFDRATVGGCARVVGSKVCDDARVLGNAVVSGGSEILEFATVTDCAVVTSGVQATGYAVIADNAKVGGHALISGFARIYGDATVLNAAVLDLVHIYDTAFVLTEEFIKGNARIFEKSQVLDHAIVMENAQVYGDAVVTGNVEVCQYAQVFGSSYLSVGIYSGSTWITGEEMI